MNKATLNLEIGKRLRRLYRCEKKLRALAKTEAFHNDELTKVANAISTAADDLVILATEPS